jgi:hypothetical protein
MVPEPNVSELEIYVGNFKSYKSPGIDKIPTEMIRSAGSKVRSEIHKPIARKNCSGRGGSQVLCRSVGRLIRQIVIIIGACHCYHLVTKLTQCPFVKINTIYRRNYCG